MEVSGSGPPCFNAHVAGNELFNLNFKRDLSNGTMKGLLVEAQLTNVTVQFRRCCLFRLLVLKRRRYRIQNPLLGLNLLVWHTWRHGGQYTLSGKSVTTEKSYHQYVTVKCIECRRILLPINWTKLPWEIGILHSSSSPIPIPSSWN